MISDNCQHNRACESCLDIIASVVATWICYDLHNIGQIFFDCTRYNSYTPRYITEVLIEGVSYRVGWIQKMCEGPRTCAEIRTNEINDSSGPLEHTFRDLIQTMLATIMLTCHHCAGPHMSLGMLTYRCLLPMVICCWCKSSAES